MTGASIGALRPMGRFLIHGEKGHGTVPELSPVDDVIVIDKPGRGIFTNTKLDAVLREKRIRNMVVCRATADVYVNSTVRETSDRDYDVLVVEDGMGSMNRGLKR
jgi:nicotinamidase-related amidase